MSTDLIGLANLSQMYYNKGNLYEGLKDYKKMEEAFIEASKFDHIQALNRLGLYYDDIRQVEKMLKYYLLAIEKEDISAMYNLARYYSDNNNFDKMLTYYLMAIELNDTDCCYELSIHYQNINDLVNMKKYYLKAVDLEVTKKCPITNRINNGLTDFNVFKLLKILNSVENSNEIYNKNINDKKKILLQNKEMIIYQNKIRIANQWNMIQECVICYESKLHLNIYCGHCFCLDCYPSLYQIACPLCRISKNS